MVRTLSDPIVHRIPGKMILSVRLQLILTSKTILILPELPVGAAALWRPNYIAVLRPEINWNTNATIASTSNM